MLIIGTTPPLELERYVTEYFKFQKVAIRSPRPNHLPPRFLLDHFIALNDQRRDSEMLEQYEKLFTDQRKRPRPRFEIGGGRFEGGGGGGGRR